MLAEAMRWIPLEPTHAEDAVYTSKDKTRCVIIAAGWRLEGDLHTLAGSRLTDSLNSRSKDFLALTDAVITDAITGEEISRPSYLAVNREAIAVIYPLNE